VFDQHVRDGLICRGEPLINSFTAGGWMVDKAPFAGADYVDSAAPRVRRSG